MLSYRNAYGARSPAMVATVLLSSLMVIFETFSSGLTIFRCIQAIRGEGPWREQTTTLKYLLLKHGIFLSDFFCMLLFDVIIMGRYFVFLVSHGHLLLY
jgi:hypothetical protein